MKTKFFLITICLLSLSNVYGFDIYSGKTLKNETLVRAFIESWNKHDINRLTSLFSENCLYEVVADGGSFSSKEGIAAYARSTFSGIPDTRMIIVKVIANDSIGVVEWIWKGTNSVGWPDMGISPTNKHFEVRGISIMEIENGLIKRNRDYWDWNTFIKGISN
jgi:steroid delta-isomerase-like uncharacterized protein